MSDRFCMSLNDLLVETFNSISKVEEKTLKSAGEINLSISELHLLEAVGKIGEGGVTISGLAQAMEITLASVTVAINKLVKKQYVEKVRGTEDGREVYVVLTRAGTRVNRIHKFFHIQMARQVCADMSEEELSVLIKGIERINDYFKQKNATMEADS